ncbi:MAG: PDZ domain-containing protein [Opitutales bacterium]
MKNIIRALNVIIAGSSLMFVGCVTTSYTEANVWTGSGYRDQNIRHNVVAVSTIGHASEQQGRLSDFVMLRGAELAIERGYEYITVIASEGLEGVEREDVGGDSSFQWGGRGAVAVFALLHEQHAHFENEFNAKQLAATLITRWGLDVSPSSGAFDPGTVELEAELFPGMNELPAKDAKDVIVFTDPTLAGFEGISIGMVSDFENPFVSDFDLELELRRLAAESGADAAVVGFPPYGPEAIVEAPALTMKASLLLIPDAAFGIQWEPGELALSKYEIRRFAEYSRADDAGLLIGDRVLQIENVDMLDTLAFHKLWLSLKPDQEVTFTVSREGKEMKIKAPVTGNLIN